MSPGFSGTLYSNAFYIHIISALISESDVKKPSAKGKCTFSLLLRGALLTYTTYGFLLPCIGDYPSYSRVPAF